MTGKDSTVISPCFIMKILFLIIPLITIILFPALSHSATTTDIANRISTLCQDSPIILLGETHQKPNSQKLFLDLVRHYGQDGDNVFVGLEIHADKQLNLEFSMLGATDFSYISSIIDHPAYRDMIYSLGAMKKNVTVKAIDARDDEVDRELVMSRNLQTALALGKYDKILVLVGNIHAVKKIKWHEDLGDRNKKYLAGLLIADGADPCSVAQMFKNDAPGGDGAELVESGTDRFSALAMEVIGHVNHSSEMTGDDVCDGVVEWR